MSARLHHWIDLTFGCRLAGEEAVASRNVPLVQPTPPGHLHRIRDRSTFRQVFELAHPQRLVDAHPPHSADGVGAETHPKPGGPVRGSQCDATMDGPPPVAVPTADVPPHAVLHGPESSWSYSLSRGLVFGSAPQVSLAVPGAAVAHRPGCGPLMAHKRLAVGVCAEDEISLFAQRHDALVDPGYGPAGWMQQDQVAGPTDRWPAPRSSRPKDPVCSSEVRALLFVLVCRAPCALAAMKSLGVLGGDFFIAWTSLQCAPVPGMACLS